ncbi:MAG: hypothetical protein A3I01_16840, partial [Betaproteobacteria bacterium RIFCSPLOWO2_02_FULL_65_24]
NLADIEALERTPLEERIWSWDVNDWIRRGWERDPDKIAIRFLANAHPEDEPLCVTYGELRHRSNQAANLFNSLGVRSGDAVVFLLPSYPELYIIQYGALAAGVACCINWMLKAETIAELIAAARAKVVLALGPAPGFQIWEQLESVRERIPASVRVLSVHAPGGRRLEETDFATLAARQPGDRLIFERKAKADDLAAYVHSGGTTGAPKLVKLPHRGFAFKCWASTLAWGLTSQDTVFTGSPLFHIAGFFSRGIQPAANGMAMVIPSALGARNRNFVDHHWALVERYRITQLHAVPTTLAVLAKNPPRGEDLSSLKPYGMTGSAPLPVEVAKELERHIGVRMISTYGSTEYTQNVTQAPRDGEVRYGSTGIRLPHTHVKAVKLDRQGEIERECATGEPGVLVLKGPSITPGYLDPKYNERLYTRDGWFKSGDMGRFDGDGYLWLTGRVRDLIIRGGHNIEPAIIEEALIKHPQVLLAAAVGKPDSYAGELPIAYVQLAKGARVTGEELAAFALEHIPERAAAPKDVHVLEQMPLTDIQKPSKVLLRHDAARRVFSAALAEAL